jgi:RNA polymerase sigma-70 factor (ECF subfamily)
VTNSSGPEADDIAAGSRPQEESARRRELVELHRETSLRERLLARDEQALVELVELASPWLLAVTQAMLHDPDEAEEVVMDTFRIVWEKLPPASQGHTRLMPYLLRIARHRSIDRLRRRRRWQRKLSLVAAMGWNRESTPAAELNEAGHPGWQVHTQVHAALEELPADQRLAVQLAYFEGLTHSEIAARLEIPLGTVKSRLRLAFARLRTTLAGVKEWVV